MPLLTDLLANLHGVPYRLSGASGVTITGITADSREVAPGMLFAALKGRATDGTHYITQALQAGAAAILCADDTPLEISNIPVLRSPLPQRLLALLAAAFYGKQPHHLVAVTGTDGKTSTADFYRQFWRHLGKPSASIGTLGILSGKGELLYPSNYTTPTPVALQRILSELPGRGIDYVCMEASSQGLDQYRMDGVRLEAAAFTNIARDHLDYHGDEEAYFAAKARLFEELLPTGSTAVLNQDDQRFAVLRNRCKARNIAVQGFGRQGAEYRIESITPAPHGQRVQCELLGKPYVLDIPLVGAFQVMNILAALGLTLASGALLDAALAVIPHFAGVPGRLERVAQLHNGAAIYVDYAHTPAALANILATLRPHTQGKLHVIFGCGGDRDPGKRPEMGRIAVEQADEVTVTDDNPRGEDASAIRGAVLAAAPGAKEVADRKQAIYGAVQALAAGDILVIAGKGHEKTQIVGDTAYPFDDAAVAREATATL